MNALIETYKTNNLAKHDGGAKMGITLLKEKIEESIKDNKSVVVSISNNSMECRNTIYTDDYEINQDILYLNYGNFELHINLNSGTEIKQDDMFNDEFIIVDENTEIRLYFID